jgi:hypothetical protein
MFDANQYQQEKIKDQFISSSVISILACLTFIIWKDNMFIKILSSAFYVAGGFGMLSESWKSNLTWINVSVIFFCLLNIALLTDFIFPIQSKVSYPKFHVAGGIYIILGLFLFLSIKKCLHNLDLIKNRQTKNQNISSFKIKSTLVLLLIWLSSSQGIFNRIILGPRDNEKMANYLHEKSKRKNEYRIGAICRDGSSSYATGSGACSWHGGVDEWLYETQDFYKFSYENCLNKAKKMNLLDYYVFD